MTAYSFESKPVSPCDCPPPSATVRLRDGGTIRLRDAEADDFPRLREMFFALSDTSRYLYFCAGVPRNDVWAERVAALARSDERASYAMVVEAEGIVVGVARFDLAAAGDSAEIGILLADAWQSRGVGARVVAWLREEAGCRALSSFTGTVLGENYRAFRLLRRAFPGLRATLSSGQYSIVMPLTTPTDGAA
jgi:acetyltransferase